MPNYAPINWRLVLCTLSGVPISILDGLASDIEFQFRLNRSAELSFEVPSEDPRVNIKKLGHPFLDTNRIVKAYRKSTSGPAFPAGGWDLKYVGRVWTLEDQGDGNVCTTSVTCYDHLKVLEKRIARAANGAFADQVKFYAEDGSQIIKKLIDRTIQYAGNIAIDTSGGSWLATADQTAFLDQEYVMPAITKLTDTGTVDLEVDYQDDSGSDSKFLVLGARPRLGSNKESTVVFSYAMAPNTATSYHRVKTLEDMANRIYLYGKSTKGRVASASSTASSSEHGVFEHLETLSDIETVELLEMLADYALLLRKDPRDLVSVTPTPEQSARPWNDYWLGDTVTVQASDPALVFPVTREEVTGAQRLYGFTIAVDDDIGEHVTDMVVSPQDA